MEHIQISTTIQVGAGGGGPANLQTEWYFLLQVVTLLQHFHQDSKVAGGGGGGGGSTSSTWSRVVTIAGGSWWWRWCWYTSGTKCWKWQHYPLEQSSSSRWCWGHAGGNGPTDYPYGGGGGGAGGAGGDGPTPDHPAGSGHGGAMVFNFQRFRDPTLLVGAPRILLMDLVRYISVSILDCWWRWVVEPNSDGALLVDWYFLVVLMMVHGENLELLHLKPGEWSIKHWFWWWWSLVIKVIQLEMVVLVVLVSFIIAYPT